jgi:hypothetical protein
LVAAIVAPFAGFAKGVSAIRRRFASEARFALQSRLRPRPGLGFVVAKTGDDAVTSQTVLSSHLQDVMFRVKLGAAGWARHDGDEGEWQGTQ